LLERVLRIIVNKSRQGYKVYINATAGYKPETTFVVIAAMLTLKVVPTIYYIHEAFKKTIELPMLPLKIDDEWLKIAEMFKEPQLMHVARDVLKKYGYNLDDLLYSGILLIDTDKGIVQTREWLRKIIQLSKV
ncbi:MAG: putative CRISPR-associated protein, partial [Thermoprotei archaeon]